MTRDEIRQKFMLVLRECLDIVDVEHAPVTLETLFVDDLHADSLSSIELTLTAEEAFDIEIPDGDAVELFRTVGAALAYLEGRLLTVHREFVYLSPVMTAAEVAASMGAAAAGMLRRAVRAKAPGPVGPWVRASLPSWTCPRCASALSEVSETGHLLCEKGCVSIDRAALALVAAGAPDLLLPAPIAAGPLQTPGVLATMAAVVEAFGTLDAEAVDVASPTAPAVLAPPTSTRGEESNP